MLWKPYPPIYPKLIKNVADGLTFEETKEMRNHGLKSLPLIKLSKYLMDGFYVRFGSGWADLSTVFWILLIFKYDLGDL